MQIRRKKQSVTAISGTVEQRPAKTGKPKCLRVGETLIKSTKL
jgi:hypothetical protein